MSPEMSPVLPPSPANADSEPFDAAAREGRFLGRRCEACARVHWYPRPYCPFCGGATQWVALCGRATVYSFSTMRRVPQPYTIAYVTLEEGPTMLTNLVDVDPDRVEIGQPVQLVFRTTEAGRPIPCFTTAPR